MRQTGYLFGNQQGLPDDTVLKTSIILRGTLAILNLSTYFDSEKFCLFHLNLLLAHLGVTIASVSYHCNKASITKKVT